MIIEDSLQTLRPLSIGSLSAWEPEQDSFVHALLTSLIYLFHQYLLRTYNVPGTALHAEDIDTHYADTNKVSAFMNLQWVARQRNMKTNKIKFGSW